MLTDKELIQKIQCLRAIQPNQDWVNSFHQTLKVEMGKTGEKQSFQTLSLQTIFGRMFRPVPLFATAGALGVIAVFVVFGMLLGNQNKSGITGNSQGEGETVLVQDNEDSWESDSKSKEKNFSVVVDVNKDKASSNARTIVLQEGDGQFEQELFDKVSEKLKKVEQMVGEISTASDARQAKELLDKAKEALNNGSLVDAFDVLVALERLLEE